MTQSKDEKLQELEAMIAHQEKVIHDLNDVVVQQGQEIETLKQYIKIKFEKIEVSLESISEADHKSVSDEALANKPPHY
ncbi:MAG: SlyX family protein [Pseudomonadota bacterium]